jgi:hypothetical protein
VAGRIRQIEKFSDLIGNETCHLPACSASTNYTSAGSLIQPILNSNVRRITDIFIDIFNSFLHFFQVNVRLLLSSSRSSQTQHSLDYFILILKLEHHH